MVWGGIHASGKTTSVFVEESVKIHKKVYQRDIREAVILPWAKWGTSRKCKLDVSTRLCTSSQSTKDTRGEQEEFSGHYII
ncbi:hypothetical protein TNCV_1772731 [Trichonephila clavipes]|nr:hypothetical protein TNCV_1772731 [Trichonephila clavipes]